MKKSSFVFLPFMAISLSLVGCGNSGNVITEHFVTFESNGGSHVETMRVKDGEKINAPSVTKTNYTFEGWFENNSFSGNTFDFNTPINKDYTLFAKWSGTDTFTITVNAGTDGQFPDGTTVKSFKVGHNTKLKEDLAIVSKLEYTGSNYQTFDKYIHDDGSDIADAEIVTSNISVKGKFRNKTLEECSWKEISEISAKGATEAKNFFGEIDRSKPITKKVVVNNQIHTVKIIGYGEDYGNLSDKTNTQLGITFEFNNLISDENGYSLATYWNNVASLEHSNSNYKTSSIRAALNGNDYEGSSKANINWFRFYGTNEDTASTGKNRHFASEHQYKNSILDMLPYDLTTYIKTTSKYVNIYGNNGWEEKTVEDKLFLLSPRELNGHSEGFPEETSTTVYSYYKNSGKNDRLKMQIKGQQGARTERPYLDGYDIDGLYNEDKKCSFAGSYHTNNTFGVYYLRSPEKINTRYKYVYNISGDGTTYWGKGCENAIGIAPAFCI